MARGLTAGQRIGGGEEIALVLDRMDRFRASHQVARTRMIELDCELGTDLLGMETPRWWYSDHRLELWRDRQKLKARRGRIVVERSRLEVLYEQQMADSRLQLLTLVQRHAALRG
jgi:hypothetical protein